MKSVIALATLLASSALAAPSPTRVEGRQEACKVPAGYALPASNTKLPDPFTKIDGTKVTTKADWDCRRKEIFDLFQKYELGEKPVKPASVTGTVSGSSISVTVTEGGKTISFSATVSGASGTGPLPAIIGIGGASIPIPAGVASINFNNNQIADQANTGSRGKGKFYDLYGSGHSAAATTAWAWGVSRILDVIEADPNKKFDVTRIGVTGCSRNGKGAFIVGALDDRIALTIPQESGSGGAASWRISDAEKKAGKNIQTAKQIITENVWFSKLFEPYVQDTGRLPVDHHYLAGLVAPRGLYIPENDIDWLGPVSTTGGMRVGREIFKALGAEANIGISVVGGHNHCSFPSNQQTELTAFIDKFLKGNAAANTGGIDRSPSNIKASDWITWTTPTLT